MKKYPIAYWTVASVLGLAGFAQAEILVGLDPATALYDSNIKGVVNDAGNQPGSAGNLSGVPVIDGTSEHNWNKGFTFNIEFTPRNADLNGTRLLIELGGNSNGSGLYLINGVPTLLSKQGSSANARPTGFPDTSLNAIGVQSSIGRLTRDLAYSFSASWNHTGTLELKVLQAGEPEPVFDSFGISGTPANWSGNNTLSVATVAKNNAGGLASGATVPGSPFNADDSQNFGGLVTRALFWNQYSVTELTLTAPVIRGFSVTRLADAGQVRFHWQTTEGGLPNPTTLEIRDADQPGNPAIHLPVSLAGFADVATSATNFILTATNANGAVDASRSIESDTTYSVIVRESGAVAWYRFNEPAGSLLVSDSAFNGAPHDGLLQGPSVSGATGFLDGAGAFEAGSAVIGNTILNPGNFAAVPADGTARNGFSIEAVVRRRPGLSGNHVLVSQTDVDGIGRAILGVDESGTIYTNVPGGVRKEADVKLPPNVWAHLVLVVDAGTTDPGTTEIRFYLNGVKIGSTLDGQNPGGATFDPNFVLEASQGLWIIGSAKNLSNEFWKGDIDDIAIYPKLLDDPDGNGDTTDSRISLHRNGWFAFTKGIVQFDAAAASVITGQSTQLRIQVGADITSVSIDNGVGTVPVVDGVATVTVTPTVETTYTLTATGPDGAVTAQTTVGYNQLTVPLILGFEATTLPSPDGIEPDKVRLHWAATEGDFPTPVTGKITYGTNGLFEFTNLRGHLDIPALEAANAKIELTNLIGTSEQEATAPAPDTAHSAVIRAAKPVAWYRFNETTFSGLIVDSAGSSTPHDGLVHNNIAVNLDETGFIDGAGTFNAGGAIITDRIIDPNDEELVGFTVEAIVETNPGTGSTNRLIVSQQDTPPFNGRQILSIDDTGAVRSNVGGGTNLFSTGRVPARAWSHVVGVVDIAENVVRWYIDGQLAGSGIPGAFFEPSQGAWIIGAAKGVDANFWRGKIDDLIVYDKILTDEQIVAHRDAWWQQTSGLLFAGPETATIDEGGEVNVSIKVGADVTGVSINPGGTIDIGGTATGSVKGSASVILNPSQTTTYTITYQTPSGPVTKTITVTVNGSVPTTLELVSHRIENGNFIIQFKGAASTAYAVKGSDDLASFPTNHGTVTTDANGDGTATIAIDPQKSSEFFRIELPN